MTARDHDLWSLPPRTTSPAVPPMVKATAVRLDREPKPLPQLETYDQIVERHAMTQPIGTDVTATLHRLEWPPPGDGEGLITHVHGDDWDGPDVTECGFYEYVNRDWQSLAPIVRSITATVRGDFTLVQSEPDEQGAVTTWWNGTFSEV